MESEFTLNSKNRSILSELDSLLTHRDRESLLESRGSHVIESAINLINAFRENYPLEIAEDLERRLINSIRSRNPAKLNRGLRNIKNKGTPE